MEIIRERNSDKKFLPRWAKLSHQALYNFAAEYVRNKNVLDCACGEGIGSEIFFKKGAASLTGVDISPEAVEIARSKVKHINATFLQGNAAKLPFNESEFDVYISIETIEHIEEDLFFLREAFRVIKPGGLFICSSPNREVMNPGKTINDKPLNKFHVREYSKGEFISILEKTFKNVHIYGINPNSGLKIKLLNKLGKILTGYGAVRVNQILKLPKFLFDKADSYIVREINSEDQYELLLAVCFKD